jgi:hypothetical protein
MITAEEGGWKRRTFSSVARLVIFREPGEVLILDPWHPVLVLLIVDFTSLLFVRLRLGLLSVVVVRHVVLYMQSSSGIVFRYWERQSGC